VVDGYCENRGSKYFAIAGHNHGTPVTPAGLGCQLERMVIIHHNNPSPRRESRWLVFDDIQMGVLQPKA
jgi:hypothetical protein